MQVDEEVAPVVELDFPVVHVMHSFSAAVTERLWSRYVPAGQLTQGLAPPFPWTYVVPLSQSSTSVRQFLCESRQSNNNKKLTVGKSCTGPDLGRRQMFDLDRAYTACFW